MSYFRWKYIQLSSALNRFTVLFGMGRSGSNSLWSSGNSDDLLIRRRTAAARKRSDSEKAKWLYCVSSLKTSETGSTVIGSSLTGN
jgi:hypothetical protein